MIPVKIIVTLCALAAPHACHDVTVSKSGWDPHLNGKACLVGQPQLAQFMADYPQYRLAGWRCEPEDVPQKERT